MASSNCNAFEKKKKNLSPGTQFVYNASLCTTAMAHTVSGMVVAMCEYVSLKARGRSFRGHGGTLLKAIEEACLRTKRIANDTK